MNSGVVNRNSFKDALSPDQCVSVGWASCCKAKGLQLHAGSGYMSGLQVWSPGHVCEETH